jgi:hypothetical protein
MVNNIYLAHFTSIVRARNNGWKVAGQGDRPTQIMTGQIIQLKSKA